MTLIGAAVRNIFYYLLLNIRTDSYRMRVERERERIALSRYLNVTRTCAELIKKFMVLRSVAVLLSIYRILRSDTGNNSNTFVNDALSCVITRAFPCIDIVAVSLICYDFPSSFSSLITFRLFHKTHYYNVNRTHNIYIYMYITTGARSGRKDQAFAPRP